MKLNFTEPHSKAYNPLNPIATGRNMFGRLVVWEVKLAGRSIVLCNEVGAEFNLGDFEKPIRSMSLAFFKFDTPYLAIEYVDGSTAIYKVDMQTKSMKSLTLNLTGYKSISLNYVAAISTTELVLAAIGDDGIYRGTLGEKSHTMVRVHKLTNTDNHRIGRFALTVDNELAIELIEYS